MQKENEIKNYFNEVALNYDNNNEKLYWKLCDQLLWNVIKKYIPLDRPFKFLDLGGGTAQWSKKILEEYPKSKCIIVDFSKNMLNQAKEKLKNISESRYFIIENDIINFETDEYFDLILNIYVLPFYKDYKKLIEKISKLLKIGGIVISVGENYYNGLALNILKGNKNDVKNVTDNFYGYLSNMVPKLYFNKINDLENCYIDSNIKPLESLGFPVLSLIGVSEILSSSKKTINSILSNDFEYIYNLEMENIYNKCLCNRGKYICVIGEKNEKN